jgi:phage tail-like protein
MNEAQYLPAIPQPPHDPTSLLLDERIGWSVLEGDKVVTGHTMRLSRFPGSLRWLTEPSGSFGGLRTPSNVALDNDGSIWLLAAKCLELKRFDPCKCAFDVVPCFGGEGSGARELHQPGGIAWDRDDLIVCDTGNARLSVFTLPALQLRGHWKAPTPWLPTSVAIGRRGTVYVADPLNGAVHRFTRRGRYEGAWLGYGDVKHIAIALDGTIYFAGDLEAFRVGEHGIPIPVTAPSDDLVEDFKKLPFKVDASGNLHLGPLCLPPSDLVFDLDGEPMKLAVVPQAQWYERAGTAILGPLDSLIDNCTWHRIILRGDLPAGDRVELDTFTSHIALPQSEIDLLPDYSWETRQQALAFDPKPASSTGASPVDASPSSSSSHLFPLTLHPCSTPNSLPLTPTTSWDCLIRSPKGRFLWIRITLKGDGKTTPSLNGIEVEFPRVSLRRFMPAVYGFEPVSADFTDRLLSLADRRLRDTELQIDNLAALFDPLSTPFPDWLATWVGVTLDRQLPLPQRRQLLKAASALNATRGTRNGLWNLLVAYLGLDRLTECCQCDIVPGKCTPTPTTCPPTKPYRWKWHAPPLILEHYKLRRWLELGSSRLGDQAMVWGQSIVNRSQLGDNAQVGVTQLRATQDPLRDPFWVYAHKFTVFVPACAGNTPDKRRMMQNLIQRESPAHTLGHIEFVEARFRIGFQSMIGLDSVVGRAPAGVRLGETPIGPASVLTGSDEPSIGTSRIGITAALD